MAIDFPASPTVGQKYPATQTAGVPTYTWDGEKWVTVSGNISGVPITNFVAKTGDTMTGQLTLPTGAAAADAVRKDYVDAADTTLTTNANSRVAKAGDVMTGTLSTPGSTGTIAANSGTPQTLQVMSNGGAGDAAYMSFHRAGYYAAHFGIDTDNVWKVGGWSAGGTSYNLWHSGNFAPSNYVYKGGDTMSGVLTVNARIYCNGQWQSNSGAAVLGSNYAGVYLRPYHTDDGTNQVVIDTAGNVYLNGAGSCYLPAGGTSGGYRCKTGNSYIIGGNHFNIYYEGSNGLCYFYIDQTHMGMLTFSSDYRIKKDVKSLPSMWDTVMALKPISYTHKHFTPPSEFEQAKKNKKPFMSDNDEERWGFIAHEVQETTVNTASSSQKDAKDAIQDLNPMPIIAALTKALQEAMTRIEALEAA